MNRERVQQVSAQSERERWPLPKTCEALKGAGVASYRFDVLTGDTVFIGNDGTALRELPAEGGQVDVAPVFDKKAVVAAIRRRIMDRGPLVDFRSEVALAGVEYWNVNMNARTCTYFGIDGGKHVEDVPVRRPA